MAGVLVQRATSNMLIGPDLAMNIEICDILNQDPGEVKDLVKILKKRIGHKNPKVQLFTLTLLDTMIKNCGDIVHMHVAEKDVPHEMVKIVKKKPDYQVKEKILVLIDMWQEAFGGPGARYRQYYAAYQELLHLGAVFPQRPERSAPIFTPPQSQPLRSLPASVRSPGYQQEGPESSAALDFPALSLTEIQNARGVMNVLAEMLGALDPGNKEGLKQEVIIDLVDQCRAYKKRVVQLVNSTSDEELLRQGLIFNDELQRVLAKHDAIAAGTTVDAVKSKSIQTLVENDDSASGEKTNRRSSASASISNQPLQKLSLPAHPASNGSATSVTKFDPNMDLLSGDDYNKPTDENMLALVPVGQSLTSSASDQNILALSDMFARIDNINNPSSTYDSNSAFLAQQVNPTLPQPQLQPKPPASPSYFNGGIPNAESPQYMQAVYNQGAQLSSPWNGQIVPAFAPQKLIVGYGVSDRGDLPPPPWEAQPVQTEESPGIMHKFPMQPGQFGDIQGQPVPSNRLGGIQPQMAFEVYPQGLQAQLTQRGQLVVMYPSIQGSPMAAMYAQQMHGAQWSGIIQQPMQAGQMAAYGYSQQPYPYSRTNELSQRMYGLSMQDSSTYSNKTSSYQIPMATSSLQQSNKPPKPEDKLFGDLVNMAKSKAKKMY